MGASPSHGTRLGPDHRVLCQVLFDWMEAGGRLPPFPEAPSTASETQQRPLCLPEALLLWRDPGLSLGPGSHCEASKGWESQPGERRRGGSLRIFQILDLMGADPSCLQAWGIRKRSPEGDPTVPPSHSQQLLRIPRLLLLETARRRRGVRGAA